MSAVNLKTGVAATATSNSSGAYTFPSVLPGVYTVSAELSGFRKAVSSEIDVAVGARLSIDLKLDVGAITESVVVQSAASQIEIATASVGNVVTTQRIQDLPLQARDAGALIALQPGVIGDNFNGMRSMSQQVLLDGVNIQESRYNGGYASGNLTTTNSVDRVAEFRVTTSPADAEFGRGAAQIQMIGRSGTNELHGSLFEFNRVTALSANDFFNNQIGRPRDFLIRNQFGARAGGPLIKNRTFWFFLYEGQRQVTKTQVTTTVFTESARQGIFRFFPGVRNGAANAGTPTVDFNGNPLKPASATGDLQSVSVFGRDPNRMTLDPTGNITKALQDYPLPNNFLRGDGLNTAGYLWQRPATADNNLYNARIDHNFTESHRLSFVSQNEKGEALNGYRGQTFPNAPADFYRGTTGLYSLGLTSTLRPNLVNEARAGVLRFTGNYESPFDPQNTKVLPQINNTPFFFDLASVTDTYSANWASQGRRSPVYSYADKITWMKGRHAIKAGGELRFSSSNGFNSFYVVPRALTGAGVAAPQNITTIPNIGTNSAAAQNLLLDLSGSLTSFTQAFNSPGGKNPQFLAGEYNQRTWRQREYAFFVQDDWKVTSNLTLNIGLRYDLYGVPFEANGKAAIPVGGSQGAFGISGTDFSAINRPGATGGQLTQFQLSGPGSGNSGGIYNGDHNNFGPAVGLSWALPYFGQNKTVLRAGYGITYDRNQLRNVDVVVGDSPGLNQRFTYQSASALSLANLPAVQPNGLPLAIAPLTDRTQTLRVFDTGLRTPYNQNWNLSIQRQITDSTVFSVRYIGSKGTKLFRSTDLNDTNIFENGFLSAFKTTQAGGNAELFDRFFMGLNVPGRGVVNGTTVRGSEYARSNATFQGYLANNRVGTFADFLNRQPLSTLGNGGYLRNAGLPENFFVTNPQYSVVNLTGNYANSIYHSLQLELEKRFAKGWTLQGSYVWSKALGEEEGEGQFYEDTYRTSRNRSFDRRILGFNRTHVLKANGTWELPVGRNRSLLGNSNRIVDGVIGGWKVSGILTVTTGRPFDLNAPNATYNAYSADNTPDVVGKLSKSAGSLSFDGNGPLYFAGFTSVDDPSRNLIADPAIRTQSTMFAIKDKDGNIVLQNPLPGTLGSLAPRFFTGPGLFNVDLAVAKSFRISERINFEFRGDLINATNTPNFSDPTNIDKSINSATLGRITAQTNSPRIIVLGGRLNF